MNVGDHIKAKRLEKGWTQTELAYKLCLSRTAVSSWEIGRTEPSFKDLDQLARVLGCRKADFFDADDIEPDYAFLINDDEKKLIEVYRNADGDMKAFLSKMINYYDALKNVSVDEIKNGLRKEKE